MYRDVTQSLDEHDAAVGAILIGEAIIAGCESSARRLRDLPKGTDPWPVLAATEGFPDLWRHLDRARRVLVKRGVTTAAYDGVRPLARSSMIVPQDDGAPSVDTAALDNARRGIEAIKLAVTGADWDAIEQRTAGLVKVPISGKQKNRLFLGGVLGGLAFVVVAWASAVAPGPKPVAAKPDTAVMRESLTDIAKARKQRIEELQVALGERCLAQPAHELVQSLVMDGRTSDARTFGDSYIERCGGDPIVEKWSKAPAVWHARPRAK